MRRRIVPPEALITGRAIYLYVRRLLIEFGGRTADSSLGDTKAVSAKLAERSSAV